MESLERRKEAMISALWANSNYDDDKGTRRSAIEEIESNFREATDAVMYGGDRAEEEIDYENPFFGAVKASQEKLQLPADQDGTVEQAILEQRRDFVNVDQ